MALSEITNIPADELLTRLTPAQIDQACDEIDRQHAEIKKAGQR